MQPHVHSSRSSTSGIPTSVCLDLGFVEFRHRSFHLAALLRYAVVTFVVEFGASGGTAQEAFALRNSERLSLFFASNFREKSSLSFMRSADCDLHHDRACAGPNLRGKVLGSWALYQSCCARAPKRTCPQIKNDGRSSWFERVLIHVS